MPFSVQHAFDAIAPRYDLANAIHSLGLHHIWNQRLIRTQRSTSHLLDLCTGTGAIALGFLKQHPLSRVTGVDFSLPMLDIAKKRAQAFGMRAHFIHANVLSLPFPDESFDGATVAYGIRNLPDRIQFLKEVYRVLQPGARFSLLDLTRPKGWLGRVHSFYTTRCLPHSGGYLTQHQEAYRYLARSIQSFIHPEILLEELEKVGFNQGVCHAIHLGVATLWDCRKPLTS